MDGSHIGFAEIAPALPGALPGCAPASTFSLQKYHPKIRLKRRFDPDEVLGFFSSRHFSKIENLTFIDYSVKHSRYLYSFCGKQIETNRGRWVSMRFVTCELSWRDQEMKIESQEIRVFHQSSTTGERRIPVKFDGLTDGKDLILWGISFGLLREFVF